jgi:hypothetical protein
MSRYIYLSEYYGSEGVQNFSQWHTERVPTSSRKVNAIGEVYSLTAKVDAIYSYISKQSIDNVPLQDLFENNAKSIDANYIKNFGNNVTRVKLGNVLD